MSTFAQRPLKSPRGLHPHSFTLNIPDWEAAVFDNAVNFVVQYYRRHWTVRRFEFATFGEAIDHERAQDDMGCIYAVTESGRFALLDRDKWDQWLERQRQARPSVRVKLARKL
jgi:hypothetical protein